MAMNGIAVVDQRETAPGARVMKRFRRWVLAIAFFSITVPEVMSQSSSSHAVIPFDGQDPDEILRRWQQTMERDKLNEKTRNAHADQLLKQLLKDPSRLSQNMQLLNEVMEFLKKQPRQDDRQSNDLQEWLKSAKQFTSRDSLTPEKLQQLEQELKRIAQPSSPKSFPPNVDLGPRDGSPSTSDNLDGNRSSRQSRWLSNMLQQMSRNETLRNSSAFRQMIKSLERAGSSDAGDRSRLLDGNTGLRGLERLPGLAPTSLPRWFPSNFRLPNLPRMSMPDVPRPTMPEMNLSFGRIPSLNMPGAPAPPSATMAGDWLRLGAMLALLLILWKMFARHIPLSAERKGEKSLGPWPVIPEAIATREELIKAFEYLSLLKLGSQARTWNHRDIAVVLGGKEIEGHETASRLAGLYEQARYAPGAGPLADDDLRAARRALSELGGVRVS